MGRKIDIDFTGVESYAKASEGIHTAKITKIEEKSTAAGDDMLVFTFTVISGEDKGCRVFDNLSLSDKALWKFKSVLEALGKKADGRVKIDLDNLIGKICDINVFWEEYNGQTRAKISEYMKAHNSTPQDDIEEDDEEDTFDEEEEEAPEPKKKKRVQEPDEEDDEEEPAPKRKRGRPAKNPAPVQKKKIPEPEPEEGDEYDSDQEDEWEEE